MVRKSLVVFGLFPVIAAILLSMTNATQPLTLRDAYLKGIIACTFKGNSSSTHYEKPLIAQVHNRLNNPITISIPSGEQFTAVQPEYQNMLVTKDGTITLNPNETKSVPIFAMCTEHTDAAPTDATGYKLGTFAQGPLLHLAQYISQNGYNNTLGQSAVWAIANKTPIEDISGFDTVASTKLQKFVSKETGRKIPPRSNSYRYNYYTPPQPEVSITGKITFNYSYTADISIGLFNTRGVVVRELYHNNATPPGTHIVNYAFDNTVYTDSAYYVRMVSEGVVRINRKISLKS